MKVLYIPVTSVIIRQDDKIILRNTNNQNTKVQYIPVTSVNIRQDGQLVSINTRKQNIQHYHKYSPHYFITVIIKK